MMYVEIMTATFWWKGGIFHSKFLSPASPCMSVSEIISHISVFISLIALTADAISGKMHYYFLTD